MSIDQLKRTHSSSSLPEKYYFVRTIESAKEELKTLEKRNIQHPDELFNMRHTQKFEEELFTQLDIKRHELFHTRPLSVNETNYTKYSPATLVKIGTPIKLFSLPFTDELNNKNPRSGLIIKPREGNYFYWYDGSQEKGPCTEQESSTVTHEEKPPIFIEHSFEFMKHHLDDLIKTRQKKAETSKDKHNLLRNGLIYLLSWNETLIRHHKSDVKGILVQLGEHKSYVDAMEASLQLADALKVRLYQYECGNLIEVSEEEVIKGIIKAIVKDIIKNVEKALSKIEAANIQPAPHSGHSSRFFSSAEYKNPNTQPCTPPLRAPQLR